METQLARAVGAMMRACKENLHFDHQSKQVFLHFSSWNFLKEIEKMFSMFLLSHRNTHESWQAQKMCGNTHLSARVPTTFLVLPNFNSFLLSN